MIGLDNWIIAAVAIAIVAEALVPPLVGWRVHYRPRHTAASVVVAVGFVGATAVAGVVLAGLFTEVYRLRAFDVPPAWWSYLLGFVVWDFLRYWRHRADHALRWLWATHMVHHSTKELNFLASFRQGWTDLVSGGWIIAIPFVWIGFDPKVIGVVITSQFLYDIVLHGEWIPKLGPLEAVLITPSNHRVHHGINDRYFNRNFGTTLLVWDRVFGTYAREDGSDPPQYGLRGQDPGYDPLRIAFHEWVAMFRDVWRAGTVAASLRALVVIPEVPESRRTAARVAAAKRKEPARRRKAR